MKHNHYNSDRFNTWQICPKRYYYKYIKEINYPEFHDEYKLGTSVHALIDYYLRGLSIEHLLSNADDDIKKSWEAIKNHPIMNKKALKTEWSFNTKLADTNDWLIGRIDAIFFDEETNKYIIADWKTGIIPKNINNNFQHQVYLYAFYKSCKDLGLNIKPENICFIYYKIDEHAVNPVEIEFSQEKLFEYEQKMITIVKNIEKYSDFPLSNICPIKFCHYNKLCGIININ